MFQFFMESAMEYNIFIYQHYGLTEQSVVLKIIKTKPGGLDVRDQSRSKTVKIIHHVEIDFYFISVEIFKIKTFLSRLRCVEIFIEIIEINRDFQDKSRQIEIFRDICR